jgi:hypothetical protein
LSLPTANSFEGFSEARILTTIYLNLQNDPCQSNLCKQNKRESFLTIFLDSNNSSCGCFAFLRGCVTMNTTRRNPEGPCGERNL